MATESISSSLNVNTILGKHDVFLTGASGFVGIFILYKLLQISHDESFDISKDNEKDIGNKIYLLLRKSKKYNSVYERLEKEILKNELFDAYTNEQKEYFISKQKIIAMEGDLLNDNVGLSNKHLNQLQFINKERNGLYFIHCAADVQFDRPINTALNLNVNGTYQCLKAAKFCNAKAFVHISTLYVNSREHTEARVMEKVYDQGFDGNQIFEDWLFKYNKELPNDYINKYIKGKTRNNENENENENEIRKDWPNTYTLTKNIAEQVVIKTCNEMNMPLSIARLGIVSPVAKGEKEGWFMGNGGFVFVAIGAASGHMKYFKQAAGNGRMDIVPADYTVNAVLAICANLLNEISNNIDNKLSVSNCIYENDNNMIYNIGIAANQPEDWCVAKLFAYVVPKFKEANVPGTHPRGNVIFVSSDLLFWIIEMCIYDIPLFLIQPLKYYTVFTQLITITFWINIFYSILKWFKLTFFGSNNNNNLSMNDKNRKNEIEKEVNGIENIFSQKKSKLEKKIEFMTKARQKMKWFNANYDYFMSRRWKFDHSNVKTLFEKLDNESRERYDFDVNKIDINHYALTNSMFVMTQWFKKQEVRRVQRKKKFDEMKERLKQLKKELKYLNGNSVSNVKDACIDEFEIIKPNKLKPIGIIDKNGKNILNESCSSMRSLLNTADKATINAISKETGHKIITDFDDSCGDLKKPKIRKQQRESTRKQIFQIISKMGLTFGGIGISHFGISLIVTVGIAYVLFSNNY